MMPWTVNVRPQKYTSAVAAQCRVHRATIAAIHARVAQLQRQGRGEVEVAGQQLQHLHRHREARDQQSEGSTKPDLARGATVRPTQRDECDAHDGEAGDQNQVLEGERFEPGGR